MSYKIPQEKPESMLRLKLFSFFFSFAVFLFKKVTYITIPKYCYFFFFSNTSM